MSIAVICSNFNPNDFCVPRRNLMRFVRHLDSLAVPVYVAELAYGDRPFFMPAGPTVFQFRTTPDNVLWHKENLLNLAAMRVPAQYRKIAWIDADLMFQTPDWIQLASEALEHCPVIQLFSLAMLTDENGRIYKTMKSTAACGQLRMGHNHPGFAWAARRELWECGHGLCELAILGGGDALFAGACFANTIPEWMYYPDWRNWTHETTEWVRRNGGCRAIAGSVVHEWHGSEMNRSYTERHALLDGVPIAEVVTHRPDGLLVFTPLATPRLKSQIHAYFASRMEDGSITRSVHSSDRTPI